MILKERSTYAIDCGEGRENALRSFGFVETRTESQACSRFKLFRAAELRCFVVNLQSQRCIYFETFFLVLIL